MTTIETAMERWNLPGMVVGVLRNGDITVETYGVRSRETGEPVLPDTIYGIGSISKVFTATLAMRLVQAGKLDLDQPVIEIMPELALANPEARATVTMRHLLTHTSGFAGDGFLENGNGEEALQEYVNTFGGLDQVSRPGRWWSYNNNALGLAGAVAARVAGTTYETAMRTYVLDPLGLERTGFGQPPVLPNAAAGYEFGADGSPEPRDIGGTARSVNPAGGLLSTVPDLLRFGAYHLGIMADGQDVFLPDDLRLEMQATQATVNGYEAWGIGWGKKLEGGSVWTIEHGGWYNGFRAQLTLIPETNEALAILTTGPHGHAAIEEVQEALLRDAFGVPDVELKPVPVADEQLDRLVGTYLQSHMHVVIERAGEGAIRMLLKTKWHGEANDGPLECPLVPVSDHEFVVTEGEFLNSRLVFLLDDAGEVEAVRVLSRICLPAAGS